jgi:hypothetical protein
LLTEGIMLPFGEAVAPEELPEELPDELPDELPLDEAPPEELELDVPDVIATVASAGEPRLA